MVFITASYMKGLSKHFKYCHTGESTESYKGILIVVNCNYSTL